MTGKAIAGLAAPVMVGDLDLDAPVPALNGDGHYRGALLLARLHGRPIGEVALTLDQRPVSSGEVAARCWPQIASQARRHCAADGMPLPGRLPAGGLSRPQQPRCQRDQRPLDGPHITVIVATRDRTDSLLRCLASLAKLDYPSFDVVIADSAPSSDATARALADRPAWPFPLRYTRVTRPGLALAHNAALRETAGEIAAITDDDVEADPGWLTALAHAFAETGATCVTGLILPAELETGPQLLVEQAGGYTRGFTRRIFTAGTADAGPLFPFTAGRFGSGANMAFRTSWLAARGGFDPATGAGTPARGGDDLTAFLAVITSGGTLVYEPSALIRHWHRRDYDGMRRQAFGYGVGLGAYLTASVCAQPRLLRAMVSRTVPAARHLLSPGSARNAGRGGCFPRELIWRERAGVATGPFAYLVSRRRARRAALRSPGLPSPDHPGLPSPDRAGLPS